MLNIIEKNIEYAIMGEFKNVNKWKYFGNGLHDTDWTENISYAHKFKDKEEIKMGCKRLLTKYSSIFVGGIGSVITIEGLPERIKIVEISTTVTDTNILEENFLKRERQKSALRKLTKQELEDLGLIEFAVLHKLSEDENDDHMFTDIDIPF